MGNKKQRKIDKLQNKWNTSQSDTDDTTRYSPKGKIIKKDDSWMVNAIQKPIHGVHESVDELELNKLVSQAQIIRVLSPVNEDLEDERLTFRKKSSPKQADNSWVKHKIKKSHPVHESVDALEINKLVS